MPDISHDGGAMLPVGDFEKLDKRQKEAFHLLQEDAVSHLLAACNDFQRRYPGLHLDFRFQVEVYKSVKDNPGTIRYAGTAY